MRLKTVLFLLLLLPLFGCQQKAQLPLGAQQLELKVPGGGEFTLEQRRGMMTLSFEKSDFLVEAGGRQLGEEESQTNQEAAARGFSEPGEARVLGGYEGRLFSNGEKVLFVSPFGDQVLYFQAGDLDTLEEILARAEVVEPTPHRSKTSHKSGQKHVFTMLVFGGPAAVLALLGVNLGWNNFSDEPHKMAAQSVLHFVLFGLPILLTGLVAIGLGSLLTGSGGGGGVMTPGVGWFVMVFMTGLFSFIAALPMSLVAALTVSSSKKAGKRAAAVRAALACLLTSAFLNVWFQMM